MTNKLSSITTLTSSKIKHAVYLHIPSNTVNQTSCHIKLNGTVEEKKTWFQAQYFDSGALGNLAVTYICRYITLHFPHISKLYSNLFYTYTWQFKQHNYSTCGLKNNIW